MTPAERAQRMAEQARDKLRHDKWKVVREGYEAMELITNPAVTFDWVAERYPGAAITRC